MDVVLKEIKAFTKPVAEPGGSAMLNEWARSAPNIDDALRDPSKTPLIHRLSCIHSYVSMMCQICKLNQVFIVWINSLHARERFWSLHYKYFREFDWVVNLAVMVASKYCIAPFNRWEAALFRMIGHTGFGIFKTIPWGCLFRGKWFLWSDKSFGELHLQPDTVSSSFWSIQRRTRYILRLEPTHRSQTAFTVALCGVRICGRRRFRSDIDIYIRMSSVNFRLKTFVLWFVRIMDKTRFDEIVTQD